MSDLPDDLPVLTEVIPDVPDDDLPLLTEVVADTAPEDVSPAHPGTAQEAPLASERLISEDELLAALQQRLETHLETVFAGKLAALQQQVTAHALAELKAELPQLLRAALDDPDAPR